ncbi:MAG: HIT family protein [Thermoproteota archaeon]
MKKDCIFCKIIEGEIQANKIFEDEETLAFLDAHPLARGHTLVIPKTHISKFEELPGREAETLFKNIHTLVPKIQRAVEAPSSTIAINNGPESGQEIPHVHVHIIPRFKGDEGGPIHSIMKRKPPLPQEEMKKIAQKIRSLL